MKMFIFCVINFLSFNINPPEKKNVKLGFVIIVLVESQSSAALYLWYYSLTNFTFSVYFCITKDMNIKIVNDKKFSKCLLSKYSLQYESFKWKNLNQKKISLWIKFKNFVCHHSFGQVNIFCSFMLILLLS